MIDRKIEALVELANWIQSEPNKLELAYLKSAKDNAWFTELELRKALNGISSHLLDQEALKNWVESYDFSKVQTRKVGLILAGNIPAVGFHDIMCLYLTGHKGLVKLSQKDAHIIPALLNQLEKIDSSSTAQFELADNLKSIDALIATGSNNSARYFDYYFRNIPRLIRRNRNSLAIIDSKISAEEIKDLGKDIFDFYGLGCRSVSQILVPDDYDTNVLFDNWDDYSYVLDNPKYENNFKYNYAVYMMNREEFKTNNFLIMKEDDALASRIACIHIKRYQATEDIINHCNINKESIQIIISNKSDLSKDLSSPIVPIGQSQHPLPQDYADGVDTLSYLIEQI